VATFVRHEPCPRCGSRDNLGKWSDGSGWCFGCHHRIAPNGSNFRPTLLSLDDVKENKSVIPPDDLCNDFPRHVVEWLARYDISIPEALKHGWKYSPKYNQLVFLFTDSDGEIACIQARNFGQGARTKYYNQGNPSEVLPIFHAMGTGHTKQRTLVVVEDVVSAARVARASATASEGLYARQSDAMPCLGSHLPVKKINALRPLYSRLLVWLDHDKWREAVEIADKAKWLGMSAKALYTEKDPKEYSDDEIKTYCEL
jgi:hypothetical protein